MARQNAITLATIAFAASMSASAMAETSVFAEAGAGDTSRGVFIRYYSPQGINTRSDTGRSDGSTASTSPASAAIGLTAISLSAAISGGMYQGNPASGAATSSADLSTGTVRATAFSGGRGGDARGLAELNEDVTFSVVGGGSQQITVISHLDGVIGAFTTSGATSGLSFILNLNNGLTGSNILFTSLGTDRGFTFDARGATALTPDGWDSYSLTNLTATGFDFVGLLTVHDGEQRRVRQQLSLGCSGGVDCDFSHTGSIGFRLPDGVSFTSGSGVFLTTPIASGVPEPTSWAMLLVGFGMVGAVARRGGAMRRSVAA